MPYRSQAQSRYIHMKAGEGVPWAQKWVSETHGQDVKALPEHVPKRHRIKSRLRVKPMQQRRR